MDRLYKQTIRQAGSHEAVLSSPADVFAVCANVAKMTSCYLAYASSEKSTLVSSRDCVQEGNDWLAVLNGKFAFNRLTTEFVDQLPSRVVSSWELVGAWIKRATASAESGKTLKPSRETQAALLYLIAAADEACAGLGLPEGGAKGFFGFVSNIRLARKGTLCRFLDPSVLRVLPKQHTPKFGLNLRNLTHHLAYCENPEVGVRWNQNAAVVKDERVSFNILLIPWPFNVHASEIVASSRGSSAKSVGYFDFTPTAGGAAAKEVLRLVKVAESKGQRIDLVVLPECALDEQGWSSLSRSLMRKNVSLLSGVAGKSERGVGTNSVRLKVPGNPGDLLTQHKHHRWKIERNQIRNYGLGGTLSCEREWWENIELSNREINFFAFSQDLVVCPLICEDLARQEPVADVVRSIGPNLVIALLMDGPQLSNRWSARYASVLADDPGSSVLTLSSLGMVNLSRPPSGADARQVIASWKESQGSFVEICLPQGHFGALLNVQFTREVEQTVDGRGDQGVASTPVLAGVHYV